LRLTREIHNRRCAGSLFALQGRSKQQAHEYAISFDCISHLLPPTNGASAVARAGVGGCFFWFAVLRRCLPKRTAALSVCHTHLVKLFRSSSRVPCEKKGLPRSTTTKAPTPSTHPLTVRLCTRVKGASICHGAHNIGGDVTLLKLLRKELANLPLSDKLFLVLDCCSSFV
jgi:hypothetical protein